MQSVGARKPQLDGLRAFAVTAVVFTHTWDSDSHLGHTAVRLFFVLSGYLITGILLRARDDARYEPAAALRDFYVRRARRILPAYYLALAASMALQFDSILPNALWHLAFASNFYFTLENEWNPAILAHLWTLSIEEQFYLLWPLLIFVVPVRFRLAFGLGAIAIALLFRVAGPLAGLPWLALDLLPPASLDALGTGAVLAILVHSGRELPNWLRRLAFPLAGVTLVLWLLPWTSSMSVVSWAQWLALETMPLVLFVVLISAAANGRALRLLGWAPIAFVGRVSYGFYLYHLLVTFAVSRAFAVEPGPLKFALAWTATLALATASWFLVERHLLKIGSPHLGASAAQASR